MYKQLLGLFDELLSGVYISDKCRDLWAYRGNQLVIIGEPRNGSLFLMAAGYEYDLPGIFEGLVVCQQIPP